MTPPVARGASVVVGAASMVGAGLVGGGWVWIPALAGAAAAGGAFVDRQYAYVQVLAVLVAVVGLASADAVPYVVVLVTGTIGAIEVMALADRVTVVRPGLPRVTGAGARVAATAALATVMLVAGDVLSFPLASLGVVGAAAAAGVALRVTAR